MRSTIRRGVTHMHSFTRTKSLTTPLKRVFDQVRKQPIALDSPEFDRALVVYTQSYLGQRVSKTSQCYALVKFYCLSQWYGHNLAVSLDELTMCSHVQKSSIQRLMRKGVAQGRYKGDESGYWPSFGLAQDMARWLQKAHVWFQLVPGKFHIQADASYFRLLFDYLSVQKQFGLDLGATGQLVLFWMIMQELRGEGQTTASDLVNNTTLSKSTVSNTLEAFVASGIVTAHHDSADERRVLLALQLSPAHVAALVDCLTRFYTTVKREGSPPCDLARPLACSQRVEVVRNSSSIFNPN